MQPRHTSSGIPVEPVYGPSPPEPRVGHPGEFPFTRGPHRDMYRGRLWTMRQYAGFGTAEATNSRFKALLKAGQTGLSVAFDLPTQMGLDSDHPMAAGEVGKVGVAIDSLEDMRILLADLPLDEISTSMTINATAPILLLLYELVAGERQVPAGQLRGTVQNDILKEYIARGTYIYPARPSMRLVTDLFAYCAERMPQWNTISVSGYHIREAGATAAEELAFTLANGLAYVQAAQSAGLVLDEFAPRLSFFWNAHSNLFEEVAKFRAARRLWAALLRERLGASEEASWKMRFHAQTAGSTLTAQQPENNIVRTTVEALAAVLGGAQSLHTNAYDEALGLPTEDSARLALRTQQIIAYESGVPDTADPLGGSYYVEALTDEIEARATELLDEIEQLGGALAGIDQGFQQRHIEDSAYAAARRLEDGSELVVGVNRYQEGDGGEVPPPMIDPELEKAQIDKLADLRQLRDEGAVGDALARVAQVAETDENLLPVMKEALASLATVGEVSDALRNVFGVYRPTR